MNITIKDVNVTVTLCYSLLYNSVENNLETWFLTPGSVQMEFLLQK